MKNVRFMDGVEVTGLVQSHIQDGDQRQVAGVMLAHRADHSGFPAELPAALVIDASGRNSQAPHWLVELGYTAPEEWRINSFVGYTTRIYQQPENFTGGWKTLYIRPDPPLGRRGGIVLPMEEGRWHVTLIGVGRDYPPTDEVGFLDFARSLPTSRLYDAIRIATPLSKPSGFRRTENRVRRYDRLPQYLDGFLVLGDAAYTLNPIYAQGMTAAALGSQALKRILQEQSNKDGLNGISRKFQKMLSLAVGSLWHSTVTKEWSWSETELEDNTEEIYPEEAGYASPALKGIAENHSTSFEATLLGA